MSDVQPGRARGARVCVALGALALGALTLAPLASGRAGDAGVPGVPGVATAPGRISVGGAANSPASSPASNSAGVPASNPAPGAAGTPGASGASGTPGAPGAPSPVVYPPPTLSLTFDHARHAQRGIACVRCHEQAARSVASKDDLMPGEQACLPCHAIDRTQPRKAVVVGQPAARCDACHPSFTGITVSGMPVPEPPRVTIPPPALKFNHKLHTDRQMACTLCHAGVETVGLATTAELPKMGLCLGCHDGRQATARCGACHPTLPDGRLRTAFPSGRLVPSGSLRGTDAHTTSFRTQHKVAGRDQKYCTTCHKQSECTECHAAGVVRPADFHPVDYASLHAVDARRNMPNCSSCHRNQTFCLGCHQRLGVAPDPEGGQAGRQPNNPFGTGTGVKRFHPPGWVRDDAGVVLTTPTPASHSFQARRNLRTCVSCHREESCLTCHSADPTRSMGVSPHPPGFRDSAACRAMSSRNTRACLKCHAPGAPALSCE